MDKLNKTPPRRQRLYFLIFSMVILTIAVAIILSAFEDNISFFKTPTELQNAPASKTQIRLGGLVKEGSFSKTEEDCLCYQFTVTDLDNEIDVKYEGMLPSLFREGQGVIVFGKLTEQGMFIGNKVLAKHDENYMPKEVYDDLKKKGYYEK